MASKFIVTLSEGEDDDLIGDSDEDVQMNDMDFDMHSGFPAVFGVGSEELLEPSDSSSVADDSDSSKREEDEQEEDQDQDEDEDEEEEENQDEDEEDYSSSESSSSSEVESLPSVKVPFDTFNVSRSLLKGIRELNWTEATPIQSAVVPVALQGRDICGSAVTGSGKTGAFSIPILERLLFRSKAVAVTRVLILTPTRELASQCNNVIGALSKYTDITRILCVGGLSSASQEAALKRRPDIVIGTPGRIIDHILNTQSFGVDQVEVLVLDEADRLLEMGFAEQIEEILRYIPEARQTMLFSATLGGKVESLTNMALRNPFIAKVDSRLGVASQLNQEFLRIRPAAEQYHEAMLLALCSSTFKKNCIVFVARKFQCHRLKLILEISGLRVAELHGNMSQNGRLDALAAFREKKVDFLLATDVAARGLDIVGVKTVINFDMPRNHETYIHRVGRTARAGRSGISISFFKERDRPMLKEILKKSGGTKSAVQRVIAPEKLQKAHAQILGMEQQLLEIKETEIAERDLRLAQQQLNKLENLKKHRKEILSRPKKEWFQSEYEKQQAKVAAIKARAGIVDEPKPKKQKKKKARPAAPKKPELTAEEIEIRNSMAKAKRLVSQSKKRRRKTMNDTEDQYEIKPVLFAEKRAPEPKKAKKEYEDYSIPDIDFEDELPKRAGKGTRGADGFKHKKQHRRKSFASKRRYKRRK